ncbi:MAG: hypothetical protein IPF55_14395 [Rhodoferax sp.]|nr:hypothetical protein [Rhodoferax sp.]
MTGRLLVIVLLFACSPSTRKLDEAMIYEGAYLRLKLVRYFENLPLHYTGEVFRVQCSSAQTGNFLAHKTQDAGWSSLGNGGAIGSKSAAELAERERRNYSVIDDRIVVWIGNGVNVSFDACGTFRGWYPASLPQDVIVPTDKPDHCKPRGNADCRHYDFLGEREPRFEDVRVSPNGQISFVVSSKALRHGKAVRVESVDFGKTWKTVVF